MIRLVLFLLLTLPFTASSQGRNDSLRLVGQMAGYYGLTLTSAEQDSMLDGIRDYTKVYEKMHTLEIPNDLAYPFAFRPFTAPLPSNSPQGVKPWDIPSGVQLPKDRKQLAFFSIIELASLIKNRRISSVELTRFFLERLHRYNDTLKCVISFTDDIAIRQATEADAEIAAGKYRGPLHGIPYGLKDLFSVSGTKTTWGSTPYKDQEIDQDAFVYQQLRNAGAVLCGKLSLGALAYNDLWFGGRTNNPWNMKQGSSGSSAGSAAATAAGLLPFAIGTETWGSIVSPSHRCGVTGLRPTFGSISRSGAMVLSWSLDKIGPICRSAADAAIVFSYLKGSDDKDASAIERPFQFNPKSDVKKLRVALAANYFKDLPPEAQQWKVVEELRKAGVSITEVNFPDSIVYRADIMNIVLSAESASAFDELTRSDRDSMIERQDKNFWPNIFRTARFIPAVEYINANRHRSSLIDSVSAFMKQFDVIITPTFSGNQLAITNLTGHPVVVFPIGFSNSGNPNSITFIGNHFDEEKILALANFYQGITEHHKKHPPFFQ